MKLLGWMHRKFRQGAGDPSKDSIAGNSCCCISGRPTPVADDKISDAGKRSSFGTYPFDDYYAVPPPPRPSSDLINGLLAIGTLGAGLTQFAADEDIRFSGVGADAQTFEIDLKLINAELEKVLFADDGGGGEGEGEEKSVTEAAATVTAAAVDVELDGGGSVTVCPLQRQGYLFGSPIEMAETSPAKKESHHHQRTSLGELFMRAKEEEPTTRRVDEAEDNKRVSAEKSTAVMQLVKKIMRRRSSIKGGCGGGGGGGTTAAGVENKMQKILHIFHRKVHPESPTMPLKKSSKQWKDPQTARKPSMADRTAVISGKEIPQSFKGRQPCGGVGPLAIGRCESNGGREFWIKTDADYLVLEL
ncbi:hypothetical protein QJS10_CPB22g00632 [Acorus calamus]|uniref:LAZY1 n=1 Tax=Acorus calamus TaxID=4465 RepID=A0AAV9BYQ4_ACOCL|nr:hypothetical protein QJS10_CPB22g00632 [Acorus calamus]